MKPLCTRFWHRRSTSGIAPLCAVLLAMPVGASALDASLVTALDRVGGNLLGQDKFDAVQGADGLELHLSTAQSQPVEIIVLTDSGRASDRLTIGGASLELEHDPNAGGIIPCVVPEPDLNVAPVAADTGKSVQSFNRGTIQAFAETGQNLLGAANFDARLFDPQPDPPALRIYFTNPPEPVHIVLADPSAPEVPVLRMSVGERDGMLHVHYDADIVRDLPVLDVDLDGASPGGAGTSGYVNGSGSKDGFTLAGYLDATGGGNAIGEFTVIVHRDAPDGTGATAVTSAICRYSSFDSLAISGGTATFHSVGDCTVLRADGTQSSFASDNSFGIVDNGNPGPGLDTVDVNFNGASGISVPGGFLTDGNFLVRE